MNTTIALPFNEYNIKAKSIYDINQAEIFHSVLKIDGIIWVVFDHVEIKMYGLVQITNTT